MQSLHNLLSETQSEHTLGIDQKERTVGHLCRHCRQLDILSNHLSIHR